MPNCESCGFEAKNERGLKIHSSKHTPTQPPAPVTEANQTNDKASIEPVDHTVVTAPASISNSGDLALLKRIEELERLNAESQKNYQMLYAVADKGRLFNWESKQGGGSQGQKVKLSIVDNKVLVGWKTLRDELVHDPKTGRTTGEFQQYELLLYGNDGQHSTKIVDGYLNFSNLRYENRIDCQVLGRSESYEGKITFEVGLEDGRKVNLDGRFVN